MAHFHRLSTNSVIMFYMSYPFIPLGKVPLLGIAMGHLSSNGGKDKIRQLQLSLYFPC